MIRVSMYNNNQEEQPVVIIVEVMDGSGITVQLSLQSGKVDASGDYTMETSWMPCKVCLYKYERCNIYEIRTFAFTDFENPLASSNTIYL
jgi:hypothetical protein